MNTTNVLTKEWDNLIILDACRYDVFKELNDIQGNLKTIYSVACQTADWVKNTFEHKLNDDIVYYSQNPWLSAKKISEYCPGLSFHKMYELSNVQAQYNKELLNSDALTKLVALTYDLHPGKKKIIHYLKPHHPYSNGMTCTKMAYEIVRGWNTRDTLIALYKANLTEVLTSVKLLLTQLKGKTIITSDHAELFGEDGLWGHSKRTLDTVNTDELTIIDSPAKAIHPKLRTVPWLEVAEPDYQSQLTALGYL